MIDRWIERWIERWASDVPTAAWQIAIVALAVAVAVRIVGTRASGLRYVLLAVLAAKLAWPLGWTSPTSAFGLSARLGRDAASVPTPRPRSWSDLDLQVPAHVDGTAAAESPTRVSAPTPRAWSWTTAFALAHASGTALVWLLVAREVVRLRRRARAARPAPDLGLGRGRGYPVRYEDDGACPTALGVLAPVVLLPRALAEGLDPATLDVVLAHEERHLRNRDPLATLAGALLAGVWWWHPAAWWFVRELRRVQEDRVDDATARRMPADHYCAALLRAAGALSGARPEPLACAMAAGEHALSRRFRRLTTPRPRRRRTTTMLCSALPLGLALSLLPAAQPSAQDGFREGPAQASAQKPPVEAALGWLAARQDEAGAFTGSDETWNALALLAFLGAGHTDAVGPHAAVVRRGLAHWSARFEADPGTELTAADAAGTWFLAEASVLAGDRKPGLARAVEHLTRHLEATGAGVLDPQVATYAALALASARDAGLDTSPSVFAATVGALPFDGEVASTWPREATTAAALLVHAVAGGAANDPRVAPAVTRLRAAALTTSDAGPATGDPRVVWLATYAVFQVGGDPWKSWLAHVRPALEGSQRADGSWPGAAGQSEFATTVAHTLASEVVWRYVRMLR